MESLKIASGDIFRSYIFPIAEGIRALVAPFLHSSNCKLSPDRLRNLPLEAFLESQVLQFLESGCLFSCPKNDVPKDGVKNGPIKNGLSGDELWIGWGKSTRTSWDERDLKADLAIYAPDFFLKDVAPVWTFESSMQISRESLLKILIKHRGNSAASTQGSSKDCQLVNQLTPPYFGEFESIFLDLKQKIQNQSIQKAVPFVFQKAVTSLNGQDRLYLLIQVLEHARSSPVHLYGVWDLSEGILGATPEILFSQVKSDPIRTVALAGTRLLGQVGGSLLDDPKERQEHEIVINGIRLSLESLGEVQVGTTSELQLPRLSHLYTPIYFTPVQRKMGFEDLVRALHPTPALGAFPKREGWNWLLDLQRKMDRKRFGAPFGALYKDEVKHCVVAIRNIQWTWNEVWVGAGCGVIAASQLDREWSEILGKLKSIRTLFKLELENG